MLSLRRFRSNNDASAEQSNAQTSDPPVDPDSIELPKSLSNQEFDEWTTRLLSALDGKAEREQATSEASTKPPRQAAEIPRLEDVPLPPNVKIGEPGYPPDFDSIGLQVDCYTGRVTRPEVIVQVPPGDKPAVDMYEAIDQDIRRGFVFADSQLALNVTTRIDAREIELAAYVGLGAPVDDDLGNVSKERVKLAAAIMTDVGAGVNSRVGKLMKSITGLGEEPVQVGGASVNREGAPTLSVTIEVPDSVSFERTLQRVVRTLSEHKMCDDRDSGSLKVFDPHAESAVGQPAKDQPTLSIAEAIEEVRRARLESPVAESESDALEVQEMPSRPYQFEKTDEAFKWTPAEEYAAAHMPEEERYVEMSSAEVVEKFRGNIRHYHELTTDKPPSPASKAAGAALTEFFRRS